MCQVSSFEVVSFRDQIILEPRRVVSTRGLIQSSFPTSISLAPFIEQYQLLRHIKYFRSCAIGQAKLVPAKRGHSPIFKTARVAKNIRRITNAIASSWLLYLTSTRTKDF